MRSIRWISLFAIFLVAAVPLSDQPIENSGDKPGAGAGNYLQGQLLVANPKMPDPRFARTVIFMCRHDATGAFGLVLNRPAKTTPGATQKLLGALGIKAAGIRGDFQIRFGGPVQPGSAFLLHADKFGGDAQICGAHGLALTSNREMLDSLTTKTGPKRSILFLGYAGWGAGQLEGELAVNSWSIAPGNKDILFDRETGTMWERALEKRMLDL